MSDDRSSLASRFVQGVGLVDRPLAEVEKGLASYGAGSVSAFRFAGATTNAEQALEFLSTLTWPATRHVAFANGEQGTALVNNARNGSDYADDVVRMPRHLGCRFARALDRPARVWQRDKLREVMQYAARIFDLWDSKANVLRSISCLNDGGRWIYSSSGEPHAIEATWGELPKRIPDRFSSERLAAVCEVYGMPLPRAEQFLAAKRFVMFVQDAIPVVPCTIAEADDPAFGYYQRGMNCVRHMETHAASVVADFERCLAIDPSYEAKVRKYLEEARRRLNDRS